MKSDPVRPRMSRRTLPLVRTRRLLSGGLLLPLLLAALLLGSCSDQPQVTETDAGTEQLQTPPPSQDDPLGLAGEAQAVTQRHWLLWSVTSQFALDAKVALEGQFDPVGKPRGASVRRMLRLLNPAYKYHAGKEYPILNPDEHFSFYSIRAAAEPARRVSFVNQFGRQVWRLTNPVGLLVPAQKQTHPFPEWLDHYKCYQAYPDSTFEVTIRVRDQFVPNGAGTKVRTGSMFCVPVYKKHGDKEYPVRNAESHIAIYNIRPIDLVDFTVGVRDQFVPEQAVVVMQAVQLAVESRKRSWALYPTTGTGEEAQ
jgi:hypothetical protein